MNSKDGGGAYYLGITSVFAHIKSGKGSKLLAQEFISKQKLFFSIASY